MENKELKKLQSKLNRQKFLLKYVGVSFHVMNALLLLMIIFNQYQHPKSITYFLAWITYIIVYDVIYAIFWLRKYNRNRVAKIKELEEKINTIKQ